MNLTPAQLQTLGNDIKNDPTLSAIPKTPDGFVTIASVYNTAFAPTFWVYRTNILPSEIFDKIAWANFTPHDPPVAADTPAALAASATLWGNRATVCQIKQNTLQIMLLGIETTINASHNNTRSGVQDALTNIPSGVNGAPQSGGWEDVSMFVLPRAGTRGEKLFAVAGMTGHDGSTQLLAMTMSPEGPVTPLNVQQALGL